VHNNQLQESNNMVKTMQNDSASEMNKPTITKHSIQGWLAGSLVVIFLVIGAAVGYLYGHKHSVSSDASTIAKSNTATTSKSVANQTLGSTYTLSSVGYPLDDYQKKFTTNLVVPNDYEAVLTASSSQQGGIAEYLSTSFNNELGYWLIGAKSDTTAMDTEASVVAIDKDWLSGSTPLANQSGGFDGSMSASDFYSSLYGNIGAPYIISLVTDSSLQTAADRQAYLTQLQSKTLQCATNSSKGFTTANKQFNICYTYNLTNNDSAEPLTMYGYATVDNQPLVFGLNVALDENDNYKNAQNIINEWISAIKQMTVTVTPNNN
jgi:hypothetical protein